jgi:glycosyltransferase involved in cell wall biosynthesis
MSSLSVVIITFNEEKCLEHCLRSVKPLADEIIILDSGSTDRTLDIGRAFGAKIYYQKFKGYIEQKNDALRLATNNLILSLDGDECLDPSLAMSILKVKYQQSARAYAMNRSTNFCGRFLRHGLWYPDRKIRLFDRRIGKWGGRNPHDRIIVNKGTIVQQLPGDILHYSFDSLEDLMERNNRISMIAARSLHDDGVRSSWYKLLIHPAWAFIKGYFFKRGFLDGFEGLSFAVNSAFQVFLKYARLYRLEKQEIELTKPAAAAKTGPTSATDSLEALTLLKTT